MHFMEPGAWIWMLIWVAVLLGAVWLRVRTPAQRSVTEDAMAILRARFARGEISTEEFERARQSLLVDQLKENR